MNHCSLNITGNPAVGTRHARKSSRTRFEGAPHHLPLAVSSPDFCLRNDRSRAAVLYITRTLPQDSTREVGQREAASVRLFTRKGYERVRAIARAVPEIG
jgi:hypothetical protein